MLENEGGVILNVASMGGLFPMSWAPAYSAAKFGVVGLSKSLYDSKLLKSKNIQTHAICPAFTQTQMVEIGKSLNAEMKKAVEFQKVILTPEMIASEMQNTILDADRPCVVQIFKPPKAKL